MRSAIDKEQAELAASRRRAGEESVAGDELAEGQMWHDPAGPVYIERR